MSFLAILLALAMGIVLGLLGGGGSILTVPILVYILDISEKVAIATSLLVVGTTSLIALSVHARAGNVIWKTGALFGVFGMIGAYLGGLVAQFIPGGLLLLFFALLMLVTGVAMLRGRKELETEECAEDSPQPLPVLTIAAEGLVVGLVTGLVGAGGGFLVVPALALLGGMKMKHAVGTSLLVIAMKSFAGFAGFAGHVEIDISLAASFTAAAVVGSLVGTSLAARIPAARLRKIFAVFVLVMGTFMIFKQLDASILTSLASLSPIFWLVCTLLVLGGAVAFWMHRSQSDSTDMPT